MGTIERSAASRRDYIEIWKFIASDGRPQAASDLLEKFDAALHMLSDHPLAGTARPDLQRSLRSTSVGNFVIFYSPTRRGIKLVRVLHGARDIDRIFRR